MKIISVSTHKRCEFIDITSQVDQIVKSGEITSGICLIFCPHTTAGLTINENADPAVKGDMIDHLAKVIPQNKSFTHLEGNSDSHIKGSVLGSSLSVIIENKKLVLGTWQGVYLCEFDGPRQRQVYVKIVSG